MTHFVYVLLKETEGDLYNKEKTNMFSDGFRQYGGGTLYCSISFQ